MFCGERAGTLSGTEHSKVQSKGPVSGLCKAAKVSFDFAPLRMTFADLHELRKGLPYVI